MRNYLMRIGSITLIYYHMENIFEFAAFSNSTDIKFRNHMQKCDVSRRE